MKRILILALILMACEPSTHKKETDALRAKTDSLMLQIRLYQESQKELALNMWVSGYVHGFINAVGHNGNFDDPTFKLDSIHARKYMFMP